MVCICDSQSVVLISPKTLRFFAVTNFLWFTCLQLPRLPSTYRTNIQFASSRTPHGMNVGQAYRPYRPIVRHTLARSLTSRNQQKSFQVVTTMLFGKTNTCKYNVNLFMRKHKLYLDRLMQASRTEMWTAISTNGKQIMRAEWNSPRSGPEK